MVTAANKTDDWREASTKDFYISHKHPYYTFYKAPTQEQVLQNHQQLQRHHGEEDTNDSEAEAALSTLPESIWVSHHPKVGLLKVRPITFATDVTDPVNLSQ